MSQLYKTNKELRCGDFVLKQNFQLLDHPSLSYKVAPTQHLQSVSLVFFFQWLYMLVALRVSKDAKQSGWQLVQRRTQPLVMCVLERWEILDSRATTILFGHLELRQQFEVRCLIERIRYVPVSLVTCVIAALSLVLSVARRGARIVT